MKAQVYNQKGEKVEEIQINDKIFGAKVRPELLAEVIRYYTFLQRRGTADTKDRGEVSGGGKKPWRQKGTGRARHGSIRSPLWRGGGVIFGPQKEKKYALKINKKVKRKALFGVLSGKFQDKEILFLDKLEIKKPKTKEGVLLVNNLKRIFEDINKKKTAFILEKKDNNFEKAIANIKNLFTIPANSLNPYFLLKVKYLVIEKGALKKIEEVYLSKKEKNKKTKKDKEEKEKAKEKQNEIKEKKKKIIKEKE